jgi:parvulin-like peptidyl-prolyl isomerase
MKHQMGFRIRYRVTGMGAVGILLAAALSANAQVVASHAPSLASPAANTTVASAPAPSAATPSAATPVIPEIPAGSPVAKVNGAVLTDRNLAREIQAIFPYANIHNGSIPKSMEPEMRKGAMEMIIFEELLYQEALREKRTVAPERLQRAEAEFRKQFATQQEFDAVLQAEVHGSKQLMREKIRRSLLIEDMLKTEVRDKATITEASARAYYSANPKKFAHAEMFSIQTISIIPPQNSSPEVAQEAHAKAEKALKLAKATKTYQEFGLLAEKMSDDDWHVNMGDRKAVEGDKLPPPVVTAALALKPGQVSDLIQLGPAYTLFRLNKHVAAGTTPFEEVKLKLMTDLQKEKTEKVRAALDQKLRKTAKIEVL